MATTDPASLINLNDIVLPADISWWPLATGWYILFALLFLVLGWLCFRLLRRWINNRYRRDALQQLQSLVIALENPAKRDTSLRQIPTLLKRTALSFYPRTQVASLSGNDWIEFLNSSTEQPAFTAATTTTMQKIAYSNNSLSEIGPTATEDLISACRLWIKNHRATNTGEPC